MATDQVGRPSMIVITGGSGFIGSVLAARLNEEGRSDLVIVDRFGTGDKRRNIAKRDFSEILPVDGLLPGSTALAKRWRRFYHLGAISSTTANDADAVTASNVNYSIALWRWCTAACKPLIYSSSAATYGDGSAGFERCARHRSPPASSSAKPLWLVKAGLRSMGDARGDRGASTADVGRAEILQCLQTKRIPQRRHDEPHRQELPLHHRGRNDTLFKSHRPDCSDGEQCRDFVYVKDCITVVVWLWRHGSGSNINGVYNLGTGKARSLLDLMNEVGGACGTAPRIEFIEMPPEIRSSYQYLTQARMSQLREIGYNAPFTSITCAMHAGLWQAVTSRRI